MRRRGGWVLVPLLAVLLTACGSGTLTPTPLPSAPAASAVAGAASVAATVPPPATSATPSFVVAAVPSPTATPTTRFSTPTRPVTPPPQTSEQAVSISNFAFVPATITVKVGTRVIWTNRQTGIQHTVTANNGSFASGDLSTGSSFSYVFTKRGTYAYHCAIHPFMTGTVIVTG